MSDNKPHWVDYANLASNVAQNVQLHQVRSTLQALAALDADRSLRELNEQQAREREDRLRDFIWNLESAFQYYLRRSDATICGTYALANQIQHGLSMAGISAASFRQFADKDRLGQFCQRLRDAERDARGKLQPEDKTRADLHLSYQQDKEFSLLVDLQDEYSHYRSWIEDRDAALKRLEELRCKPNSKVEELRQKQKQIIASPPLTRTGSVGCVFMLVAVGSFVGSIPVSHYSAMAGSIMLLVSLATFVLGVVITVIDNKRQPKVSREEREKRDKEKQALEAKIKSEIEKAEQEHEDEIDDATTDVELADDAIQLFDPQRTEDEGKMRALTDERERLLRKYGVNDPAGLEQERLKRESFCRQFEQDNNLGGDADQPKPAMTAAEEAARMMEESKEKARRRSEAIKDWWARQPKADMDYTNVEEAT